MGKDEIEAVNKDYKIQRTRNGKETIDGHVCDKDNVSLLDDKGVQQKAIVWFAKDLKDFPVQIQLTEGEATLVMHFKEIKLGRPEASHFEKPTGMKKFDTMEQLTTDAAMRKVNSAFTK